MKKRNLLLAVVLIFFIIACSKKEGSNESSNGDTRFTEAEMKVLLQMRGGNNRVDLKEATRLAEEIIGFLDGETAVKSGSARQIASILPLGMKNPMLKSSDGHIALPDTLVYVFNFSDSAGFAIISADTRIDAPVLAYASSGTLGMEIDNPGMGVFLQGAEDYIKRCIEEAERSKEALMSSIIEKLGHNVIADSSSTKVAAPTQTIILSTEVMYRGPWVAVNRRGPLSKVEWSQWAPFNQVVETICGDGKAPAGCVAVATAQIMSYWQYPTSIDNISLNWTELNKYSQRAKFPDAYRNWVATMGNAPLEIKEQAANLMRRIGDKVGIEEYTCEGSGAETEDAVSFLRGQGYTGGDKSNFNHSSVVSSLYDGRPVLIDGFRTVYNFLGMHVKYEHGHTWVVDGYLKRQRELRVLVTYSGKPGPVVPTKAAAPATYNELITTYESSDYLHHNWGWGGNYNGWFIPGCFDSQSADTLHSNTKSSDGNYQYDVNIFTNLRLN